MTIYCIGRNYIDHAKELGNDIPTQPLIFLKADCALRGLQAGPLAFAAETFHYEAELVLTIGENLKLGQKVCAHSIESISVGLDITRREIQNELKKKGLPWTLSKSFAGSAILGKAYPFAQYAESNVQFEFRIGEKLKQRGESKDMIFSFLVICNFINSFSPLRQGDIIFTGTPSGVGPIRQGDSFSLKLAANESEPGML